MLTLSFSYSIILFLEAYLVNFNGISIYKMQGNKFKRLYWNDGYSMNSLLWLLGHFISDMQFLDKCPVQKVSFFKKSHRTLPQYFC